MQGGSRNHTHKYGQLCQSLLDLELAAERIFNVITNRVSLEHYRLEVLKNRIQSAKDKVDAITGTNRATTIFSSSKYPIIPPEVEDFIPVFGGKIAGVSTDFPLMTISLSSGQCQSGGEGTIELFRFFSETSYESWSSEQKQKGIGSLPAKVNSIADALLFNTTESPYLKYRVVDNLAGADQLSVQEPSTKPITLPPAPQSVLESSAMRSSGSEDFGFRPVLGQVPSFSLPSMLPDLPMVAEISWSGLKFGVEQLPSIAPSAVHNGASKDVSTSFMKDAAAPFDKLAHSPPDVSYVASDTVSIVSSTIPKMNATLGKEDSVDIPTKDINKDVPSLKTFDSGQRAPVTPPPPPPPPPPSVPISRRVPNDITDSSMEATLSHYLVTPKTVFPETGSQGESHATARNLFPGQSVTSQSLPSVDSQRADLLASIRDPGITLRKTGLADHKRDLSLPVVTGNRDLKAVEHQAAPSGQRQPMNLLAEMATTLKMRRISMQGAAHDKEQVALKSGERMGTLEDTGAASPSGSSGKFTLPIANLHAYIAKKNEEVSDNDEEWDD